MKRVGQWILQALKSADNEAGLTAIRGAVADFARSFPVPGIE
jgi:glycine hydroxymethyltransferase